MASIFQMKPLAPLLTGSPALFTTLLIMVPRERYSFQTFTGSPGHLASSPSSVAQEATSENSFRESLFGSILEAKIQLIPATYTLDHARSFLNV